MKKYYDKLVRDRIPETIERENKEMLVHQVTHGKFREYALQKLREEVEEFIENPCAEEAADILEILDTICAREGIRSSEIRAQKISKRCSRGGFDMGFILEWVEEP